MAASQCFEVSVSVGGRELVDGERSQPCGRCQVAAVRELERKAMDLEYRCPNYTEWMLMLWSARTVESGEFRGYSNSDQDGAAKFRRALVLRNLRGGVVDCSCEERNRVDHDSMLLVKPAYRGMVHSLFGDKLTVGQLLLLPVGTIDWSALEEFGVEKQSVDGMNTIVRGGGQIPLANYLLCARREVYGHEQDWFRTSEKMLQARFGYGSVFLPRFRSIAVATLGAFPDMFDVWKLPLDWVDWQAIASLHLTAFSTFAVWRAGQFPQDMSFSQASSQMFVERLLDMPVGDAGTYVGNKVNLVLQSTGAGSEDEHKVQHVKVLTGRTNCAALAGWNQFVTERDAVLTFPTGCFVESDGVVYGAPDVRVSVAIRRSFICCLGDSDASVARARFPVRVSSGEDYVDRYVRRKLNPRSTDARFLAHEAKMVVLDWPDCPALHGDDRISEVGSRVGADRLSDDAGTIDKFIRFSDQDGGNVVDFGYPYCVLQGMIGVHTLRLNRCVIVTEASHSVGFTGAVACERVRSAMAGNTWVCQFRFIYDAYAIDGGGLSPDVSDYDSEFVADDFGDWYALEHAGDCLASMTRDELAAVPGYCYVALYKQEHFRHYAKLMRKGPSLLKVLDAGAFHFREDYEDKLRLAATSVGWHVTSDVGAKGVVPWAEVWRMLQGRALTALRKQVAGALSGGEQVKQVLRRVGNWSEFPARFEQKLLLVVSTLGMLGAQDKEKARVLQICGDSFLSMELALSAALAGHTAQQYQERRAVVTANSFLSSVFHEAFESEGFSKPPDVNLGIGKAGAELLKAMIGLVYTELGRTDAAAFAVAVGVWGDSA